VLEKVSEGTMKATLIVIPARFGGMPEVLQAMQLSERVQHACSGELDICQQPSFDQAYANHYASECGPHIHFHHDHHACIMGVIAGVSLGSSCDIMLRTSEVFSIKEDPLRVPLPRRSVYFMTGLSRWHFQHGIFNIPADRTSVTFRTVDRNWVRDQWLWDRDWSELSSEEQANALWPLLPITKLRENKRKLRTRSASS